MMKSKAEQTRKEASALDRELMSLDLRQDKWVKVSQAIGFGVAIAVFVVMASQPDSGFKYEAVLLALVLSVVSSTFAWMGLAMLGKFLKRAQYADWAQRAERVVREYSQAAS
jgi:hypothetical protein